MYDIRIQRRKGFKEYHALCSRLGESGGNNNILRYIARKEDLDLEERCYLTWLYSASYSWCTAWYIFQSISREASKKEVEAFWNRHRDAMLFQTDRKWVKLRNEFVPMFLDYQERTGNSQWDYYNNFCYGEPEDNFKRLLAEVKTMYFVKRYAASLLYELLADITPLAIAPYDGYLDLREARTVRQGLQYILGEDLGADLKVAPRQDYPRLQVDLTAIMRECVRDNLDFKDSWWDVETCLCRFRNMMKGERYWGFYTDRGQEEIHWYEQNHPEHDWSVGWEARAHVIHPSLLGEFNGWTGIRKWRYNYLPQHGYFQPDAIPRTVGRYWDG